MTRASQESALHVRRARAPYDARDLAMIGAAVARRGHRGAARAVRRHAASAAAVGLIVIMTLAYALSTNRRAIDRRTVAWGLRLQMLFRADRAEDLDRAAGLPDARRR